MPDQEVTSPKRAPEISRRDLLRRGAIVGGNLLWAAPVIQSMGGRALAYHNVYPSCCECKTLEAGCHVDHITQEECAEFCGGEDEIEFYSFGNFHCEKETTTGKKKCVVDP